MILTKVEWNCTTVPEKGKYDWTEVSARASPVMQLFVGSLINLLLDHLSNGKSSLKVQRYGDLKLSSDFRNGMLKIVYAGHGIFKDKYFGVYRRDSNPLLSLEVSTILIEAKLSRPISSTCTEGHSPHMTTWSTSMQPTSSRTFLPCPNNLNCRSQVNTNNPQLERSRSSRFR